MFGLAIVAQAHCGACGPSEGSAKAEMSCDKSSCDKEKSCDKEASCCGSCSTKETACEKPTCGVDTAGKVTTKEAIPMPKMACCPADT